jgi:hypothetical protein
MFLCARVFTLYVSTGLAASAAPGASRAISFAELRLSVPAFLHFSRAHGYYISSANPRIAPRRGVDNGLRLLYNVFIVKQDWSWKNAQSFLLNKSRHTQTVKRWKSSGDGIRHTIQSACFAVLTQKSRRIFSTLKKIRETLCRHRCSLCIFELQESAFLRLLLTSN